MNEILGKIEALVEAIAIRLLWMFHALGFRRTPGLCPPACREGHTYKWPCRARIRRPKTTNIGAYRDAQIQYQKNKEVIEDQSKRWRG